MQSPNTKTTEHLYYIQRTNKPTKQTGQSSLLKHSALLPSCHTPNSGKLYFFMFIRMQKKKSTELFVLYRRAIWNHQTFIVAYILFNKSKMLHLIY